MAEVWETVSTSSDQPEVTRDFAEIWRAAEKIVYSRTLQTPSSARIRIERDFDSGAIRQLKESSAHDVTIGGAELAARRWLQAWSTNATCSSARSGAARDAAACSCRTASRI